MTNIIHIRDKTGSSDEVYIGRGSKWGNPFRIGGWSREDVIAKYALHIKRQKHLLRDLHELKGKNLVCYCAPQACHGDVLKKLANGE